MTIRERKILRPVGLTDVELGSFDITSGRIAAADPGHGHTRCGGILAPARCGQWHAAMRRVRYERIDLGERVTRLVVHHEDVSIGETWEDAPFDVGVDGGVAGFWDAQATPSATGNELGASFPGGVVTSTGFGDGGYPCIFQRQGGEIVAAALLYITPDNGVIDVTPPTPEEIASREARTAAALASMPDAGEEPF